LGIVSSRFCDSSLAAAAFSRLTAVAPPVTDIVSSGTILGALTITFLNFLENLGHDSGLRFLCLDIMRFYPSYEHCQSIELKLRLMLDIRVYW
jgi:hypothetical protein